jgi:hypothetical protein
MTRTRVGADEPDHGEPEKLAVWLAAGFAREDAENWRRWRFKLARAEAWKRRGVLDGLRAAQWQTAGVKPETVEAWRAAGIGAPEAVRWHELGYGLEAAKAEKQKGNGPEQAFAQAQQARSANVSSRLIGGSRRVARRRPGGFVGQFQQSGVDHQIMSSYAQHQWFDEEALEWAKQGIEAQDAYTWYELGLTASEAGRLAIQGRSPGDVIREWWSAGIPFEEVADWIGAGLGAKEAVDQRAKGITTDQAAALRALRQEDAPPLRGGTIPLAALVRHGPPRSEAIGPPPEDEESARAQIGEVFSLMLTGAENGDVPAVDGGSNLGDCLAEAARRHGAMVDQGPATKVTADFVRFINDHEARVSYSVVVTGPFNANFPNRPGRAVLADGVWKVARETFCEFMEMTGVTCPPRDNESR